MHYYNLPSLHKGIYTQESLSIKIAKSATMENKNSKLPLKGLDRTRIQFFNLACCNFTRGAKRRSWTLLKSQKKFYINKKDAFLSRSHPL